MAEEKKQNKTKQELYMEIQGTDQQLKQLQEYSENFENQILNINNILESLDEFEKAKPGANILAPLQNGIFIEAKLGESKKVKVNIGSNTVVEKTIPETKEMMNKQLESVRVYKEQINIQIEQLTLKLQQLEKEAKE